MLNFMLKSGHRKVIRSIAAAIVLCSSLLNARSAQAVTPTNWTFTLGNTVAKTTLPGGTIVTATISGTTWYGSAGTMYNGTPPSSFPATTGNPALGLTVPTGCLSTTTCGNIVLTFSKPITTPKFHISDLGGFTGSGTISGFRFSPMTITSGQTLTSAYQGSNTQLINANKTVTLKTANNVGKSVDIDSCGSVFGCGSYSVVGTAPYNSLTLNIDPIQSFGSPYPPLDVVLLTLEVIESVTVSGTVFNDTDGSKVQTGTEVGTNGGGLNAVLVDSNNLVIATTPVAATGAYSFSNVNANANYTVLITTNTATPGSAPPAVNLPSGWTSTGENLNGIADATVDSTIAVPVTTTNVTGANFGIKPVPIPITCSSVYIDSFNNKQIYSVNTATAATTPVATLPVVSKWGIAVLPGTTPTLYSDTNTNPVYLTSTNGTTTTTNASATLGSYKGGLGSDVAGNLFYISNSSGSQKVYRFSSPYTSPAVAGATITSTDPIWPTLSPGDMMSDGNGRLYYFGVDGSFVGGLNYLFYIDSSNVAHRLGSYKSANAGIGVAFDQSGQIYTLDSSTLYQIDLTNGFSSTSKGITGIAGIDMGSCARPIVNPSFNSTDGIGKQVRNVTTNKPLTTQNTASVGDILEYQITIKNSGNLPSDSTKFSDSIPTGTTYVANSTKIYDNTGTATTNPATAIADLTGGAPPFTAAATGTTPATAAGMLVNTYGQLAGIVLAGTPSSVVVKFQVEVTATTGIIPNAANLTYPVTSAAVGGTPGTLSTASQASNFAKTTLSVNVSGTVWNDLDLTGKSGTIFTTGELGTNASSSSFYAYLVDSTNKVIASSPISATGKYSFPGVAPNQTRLQIELSTTPPTSPLASMTLPAQSIPTGWKKTAPLAISAINTVLDDVPNEDFGIVQGANVVLVKRITGIKPFGTNTWVTTNPNDGKNLTTVVHNTPNDAATVNWPSTTYLAGAVTTVAKPGDQLEYTIYYLNTQGADASSLKICDPIRSTQKYNPGSMKLSAGGATPIGLTDVVDAANGADRANAYGVAALPAVVTSPTDCNIGGSGYTVAPTARDNGGIAIQLVGASATKQLDLLKIPNATPAGTPAVTPPDSYGLLRFTTTVEP
jgi:uncharacterized repeat protein (TIGR01451 family)